MSVYVDGAKLPFGRMTMCHMVADTLPELHAMADQLGLRRAWFQASASTPHYDLSISKRALAVKLGAVEVDRRGLVDVIRRLRAAREMPTMTCPRCKAELPDFDGFGVLAHTKPAYADGCGYCSHPSRDDGVCGICGDKVGLDDDA